MEGVEQLSKNGKLEQNAAQEAVRKVTAGVMVPPPQQRGSITTSSALLSSKCHVANPRQLLGSGSFRSKPLSSGEENEANMKCFKFPSFQLKAAMSKAEERASEEVFMTEDAEILEDKGEGYNNVMDVDQDQNQEKVQQNQETDSPSGQYVLKAAHFQSDDEDALSDSIDP
jgi:hypothetical protein